MTCATHTDQPASAYCRTCGKALCQSCQRDVRGVIYCQDCLAARLEGTVPAAAANAPAAVYAASSGPVATSPGLAAILGFIPGVGAFYNGQYAKGFVHVFVFALVINLTNKLDWFGFAIPAWIFYMVFDAYATAKARLMGQPAPDPIGLNALLSNFGLGGTPPPAVPAPAPPASTSAAQSAAPAQGAEYVNNPAVAPAASATDYADPAACGSRGIPTGALILIIIGVFFLLANLGVLSFRWTADFWPVILIVIGVWLVLRRLSGTQVGR
jgi:TM2 domain-containing membrane protein YozV